MIKKLLLLFLGLVLMLNSSMAQGLTHIEVSSDFDFQQAIAFVNQQRVDTIFLTTPGGVYTTTDTLYFNITSPLVIMPKPGITDMPIITHSDDSANVIEIFRVSNDLTLQGVILDGGHERTHGMKYAVRAGNGPNDYPLAKKGMNITLRDCIIRNMYDKKDVDAQGYALYFLVNVEAGIVKVENCRIENIGDEAIRMTETEKFATTKVVDSLVVRNCTFTNVDAECVRFYGDVDTSNVDGAVLIENLTINNCATRAFYIKNNKNTIIRNVMVTNSRLPGLDRQERADYILQVQLPGSMVTNIDTLNIVFGPNKSAEPIGAAKGAKDIEPQFLFNFDPLYANASGLDFTLAANSPAFYSGVDNTNLGDNRWATANPTVSPLNLGLIGKGSVTFDPPRQGLVFPSGTSVSVTAVPDSGYEFISWGGDLSGNSNPQTITVTGRKNITATFEKSTTGVNDEILPSAYSLEQNYPNPFNPSTMISFSLKEKGFASLKLYDAIGREIRTLFEQELSAGYHNYYFNANGLATGVYYYQITAGDFTATKKMMLVK